MNLVLWAMVVMIVMKWAYINNIQSSVEKNHLWVSWSVHAGSNSVFIHNPPLVRYIPASNEYPRMHTIPKDRKIIWCDIKGRCIEDMGTYQPETDGYQLCSVDRGSLGH